MEASSPSSLGSVDFIIRVRWEGTEENLAEIKCSHKHTLKKLAEDLSFHVPQMKDYSFAFVHAGIPIRPELWHMVPAMKLQPIAYIREGVFDFIRRPSEEFLATASFDFEDDKLSMTMDSEASLSTLSGGNYLSFRRGDVLVVSRGDYGEEWWYGHVQGQNHKGWFPKNRVLTDRYTHSNHSE